jgi:triphosphoribosyl-dephospho-CoA synthase
VHVTDRDACLDIGAAAQLACLLEVSAAKPGNVSPGVSFGDTNYLDFLASAAAVGRSLGSASRPLGEIILMAVRDTRQWVSANTNLGIVLLFAPLARAAALRRADHHAGPIDAIELRRSLTTVLAESTIADARATYEAIRLASPGGLGTAESQDVAQEPTVTLTAAMHLAADRDGIASEYATGFRATFDVGAVALRAARRAGLDWNDAVVETYLTLLAAYPDSHIARRAGHVRAGEVLRAARAVLDLGGVRSDAGRNAVSELNAELLDWRNLSNPGTTADITAAAIFVTLLTGGWHESHGGSDATLR